MGKQNSEVAVMMVPLPAQGHLNQLLHLSHHIVSYGLPVHFTGSPMHNRQAMHRSQGWDPEISTQIHFHDFHDFHAPVSLRKPVFELSQRLSTEFRRIIVVHDQGMASVVQDVMFIPNAELFHFVPTSAFTEFFRVWEGLAEKPFLLDKNIVPRDLPSTEGATTPEIAAFISFQDQFLKFGSGKLYNTSMVIDGEYVRLFERLSVSSGDETKHFAIGPFNPVEPNSVGGDGGRGRHMCLEWLDQQEKCSVLYISFGSTVSLPEEQIRELAAGLEESGQKFIWVIRKADIDDIFAIDETSGAEMRPPEGREGIDDSDMAIRHPSTGDETREPELPEGYEERIQDRGMVIKDWAPQLEILAHPSTGGFMSHCGWNSCQESISMGVPIAAWPMHSDQPRNAVLITEILRVGMMVRDWEYRSEVVKAGDIESVVKRLMISREGEDCRKRAEELGDAVRQSVTTGGSSVLQRDAFISHITR